MKRELAQAEAVARSWQMRGVNVAPEFVSGREKRQANAPFA